MDNISHDEYRQTLIDKHVRKTGLKGKLIAKCIECIYDPYQPGSWRKQVEKCTCLTCPLYPVRPMSTKR